jgi:hypothetical protein
MGLVGIRFPRVVPSVSVIEISLILSSLIRHVPTSSQVSIFSSSLIGHIPPFRLLLDIQIYRISTQ